jgi:hypothetical protein
VATRGGIHRLYVGYTRRLEHCRNGARLCYNLDVPSKGAEGALVLYLLMTPIEGPASAKVNDNSQQSFHIELYLSLFVST